jgi:hypothetical protein
MLKSTLTSNATHFFVTVQVPGVSMSSNVLDRIHSMRQQWGGIHQVASRDKTLNVSTTMLHCSQCISEDVYEPFFRKRAHPHVTGDNESAYNRNLANLAPKICFGLVCSHARAYSRI